MGSSRNSRADTEDYARLFLEDVPLMDTRAPGEFRHGAFPMAESLPLMSDEERAAVGTCYKERGQASALELGHSLVSGELREERMAGWRRFAAEHPQGYLYCFRGGLRSEIVQRWLAEAGVDYPRVTGGYKAMRRFLIDTLEERVAETDFILVAGATGSGKTRAVNALPRSIDLEGLAQHRGSAFGRLLDEQPTQIDFENRLAIALLKLAREPGPVLLEDEGRLIGRIALPESLRRRMETSPLLVLEEPLEARVQVLLEDYIVDLGARYRARCREDALAAHRERLLGDLARIRKRLGGERQQRIAAAMEAAFAAQAASADGAEAATAGSGESGDIEGHREWIRMLLTEYYDPMYEYQMSQRGGERLFRGSRAALVAHAQEQYAGA